MHSSDNPEFAIDLSDLDAVIELLSDQQLVAVDDFKVRDLIISDLEKLPSTDIGPFSISFLNCQGGGSEWVSIDVGDEGMEFLVGNHSYTPGVGGDTFSEITFQCWGGGGTEGYLNDWLSQLNSLDRNTMKIDISHEFQEDECDEDPETNLITNTLDVTVPTIMQFRPLSTGERAKMTSFYRQAASDPRLKSEVREIAQKHSERLQAIPKPDNFEIGAATAFDRELSLRVIQLMVIYFEGGTFKFADVAFALAADLDVSLSELKPYLRCWYEGIRCWREDAGEPVDAMDSPEAVKGALSMIEKLSYP